MNYKQNTFLNVLSYFYVFFADRVQEPEKLNFRIVTALL
jgi:hypothetical protein